MRIHLLGTGASDSWPDPFCVCPSCTAERAAGRTRANTCALVDNTIMCDWGPHATLQGQRFGVDFTLVRAALITHGHPDHFAPQFLMWRSWLPGLPPLHVYGPAQVIADAEHWVGAHDVLHVVTPFESWTIPAAHGRGPWQVTAIPANHTTGNGDGYADECLLYDISDAAGHRLLYATDTAMLPADTLDAIRHEPWDVVLLEETFGRHTTHGSGHLDLPTFATCIERMRERGLVTEHTQIVAIHLGHHNPPLAELRTELAGFGADVFADGTVLNTRIRRGIVHLVLGGTKSGKSSFAETLAAEYPQVLYVATGYPADQMSADPAWQHRIAMHRDRRPAHWQTIETIDLVSALDGAQQPVLIDCLNLWLTRILDDHWTDPDTARAITRRETDALLAALDRAQVPVIVVSNDVSTALIPPNEIGRLFQELLGEVNARLAAHCDDVTMMIAGRPTRISG